MNRSALLVLVGVFIFLMAFYACFDSFIVSDEVDFVKAGEEIATSGIPVYYSDEAHPDIIGLWHPPLYISLIGLGLRLFNYSSAIAVAQIIGLSCFFLSLFLIYLLSRELVGPGHIVTSLALFLYAITPLTIKGALLIDIDNTILVPLMTLFLFIFIRREKGKVGVNGDILLGLLFGGCLWAKFHSLLLIPSIVLYQLLNRQYLRAVKQGLIVSLVGWGFFLGSWWIYSHISQLPFINPFIHNFGSLLQPSASSGSLLSRILFMLGMLRNVTIWTSPFILLLLILFGVKGIKDYFTNKGLSSIDLLVLFSLVLIAGYSVLGRGTAGFPRYYAPMMPALSIAIASMVSQYIPERSKMLLLTFSALVIGGIAFCFFVIGDPLLLPFAPKKSLLNNAEAVKRMVIASLTPLLFYLGLLGAMAGTIKATLRGISFFGLLTLASFLSLISGNLGLDIIQIKPGYATMYNYGEKGMKETIEYLKGFLTREDILICPKDIAYYLGCRFLCNMHPPSWTKQRLQKAVEGKAIKYVVFRKSFYYQVDYDPRLLLASEYKRIKDFESFEIYERR